MFDGPNLMMLGWAMVVSVVAGVAFVWALGVYQAPIDCNGDCPGGWFLAFFLVLPSAAAVAAVALVGLVVVLLTGWRAAYPWRLALALVGPVAPVLWLARFAFRLLAS